MLASLSLPGLTGQSNNPCAIDVSETLPHLESGGYWIAVEPGDDSGGFDDGSRSQRPPPITQLIAFASICW
jgi:hypothetical protein